MDENKGKLSRELWVKIICVILSVVTFGVSAGFAFGALRGIEFYGGENAFSTDYKDLDFTDSNAFYSALHKDVEAVKTVSMYDNGVKTSLKNQKDKVVGEAVKKFVSTKAQYDKAVKESSQEGSDYDESETVTDYYVYDIGQDRISFEKNVVANGSSYYFSVDVPFEEYKNEKIAKQFIEKQYDEFVESEMNQIIEEKQYAESTIANTENFKFLVVDSTGKTLLTNLDKNQSEKDILVCEINFSSKNGKVTCNNADIIKKIQKNNIDANLSYMAFPKNVVAYFAVDTAFESTDEYSIMSDYAKELKTTSAEKQIVVAIIALAVSFAFAIFVFANSGKNNSGTPKLAFVDYVPLDIHLVINGLLIAGAIFVCSHIFVDLNNYSEYDSFAVLSQYGGLLQLTLVGTVWALLLEYICSVIRTSRVKGKEIWKKILGFFIIYKIAKCIKSGIKKAKENLSYTPENYEKNIIKISVLLFIAEFVLLGLGILFAFAFVPLGILIGIAFVAFNVFVYVKLLKYFIKLDEIITSAKERKIFEEQLDELPKSLKTLAECLNYSNEELDSAVARAVKDERLKTELITNVSHDLKTPLTSIITYVDLLSKCDINDEKAKEYIKVLDEKGTKLKRLIEDLVEASKLSSGNVTVNITRLNLSELATQAVGENQFEFEKNRLELILQESNDSVIVNADGSKTFRIIENLLSNAKKYSAMSSRIYVSVYSENGAGVFEIKNISAEPLNISPEELTERFVRGDSSRTKDGNGLGLSIAKELCKAQNAKLDITIDGDLFKAKVTF